MLLLALLVMGFVIAVAGQVGGWGFWKTFIVVLAADGLVFALASAFWPGVFV